jgi:hypothetical protein
MFAHLDQTTVSLTGRLNYMSPTFAAVVCGALRVGRKLQQFPGAHGRPQPRLLQPPQLFDYSYAANGNPDFSVKSFRTTNVLRWEYRPGSTLFVVWQQARENDLSAGAFRFGRDARAIFGVPPHNVFLIKLAYWLNV